MSNLFCAKEWSSSSAFNQPIGGWRVGEVTTMRWMFQRRLVVQPADRRLERRQGRGYAQHVPRRQKFNQPLDGWNVAKVRGMSKMFLSALDFDQDLGWCAVRGTFHHAFTSTPCASTSCGVMKGERDELGVCDNTVAAAAADLAAADDDDSWLPPMSWLPPTTTKKTSSVDKFKNDYCASVVCSDAWIQWCGYSREDLRSRVPGARGCSWTLWEAIGDEFERFAYGFMIILVYGVIMSAPIWLPIVVVIVAVWCCCCYRNRKKRTAFMTEQNYELVTAQIGDRAARRRGRRGREDGVRRHTSPAQD